MPRHPTLASRLSELDSSVYSSLAGRLAQREVEVYPLHIGDTWLEPAPGCRMEDLRVDRHPGLHRYAPIGGLPRLVERIAERTTERSGVDTRPENVVVAAGATGGLSAVMGTLLDPGDEVLIVAPYWPLIPGIVRCAGGVPVTVPLLGEAVSADDVLQRLESALSARSVAIYFNTPNNPSGCVLPASWIDAIATWAATNDLWLISDEVYEDYVYEGTHRPCRAAAAGRTIAVHSFSKAFGMAGNRCGFILGPASFASEVKKLTTHTIYCAPRASQQAALLVLSTEGDAWVADARTRYAEAGRAAARRLGVAPPEGGTFVFLDVAEHLDERGLLGFLERCVDRGLLLAPGPSFGPYPTHVRLCFTCVEPAIVERGVDVLARLIGR